MTNPGRAKPYERAGGWIVGLGHLDGLMAACLMRDRPADAWEGASGRRTRERPANILRGWWPRVLASTREGDSPPSWQSCFPPVRRIAAWRWFPLKEVSGRAWNPVDLVADGCPDPRQRAVASCADDLR
jgi:hypothetical protein